MTGLSVDYAGLAAKLGKPLAPARVGQVLLDAAEAPYERVCPDGSLVQITQSGAVYLFDLASAVGADQEDRTVAAWTVTPSYQRGYPSSGRTSSAKTGL